MSPTVQPQICEILGSVERPYRYAGGEVGSIAKGWEGSDTRVCLVFPDIYEIGMSHMGMAILYGTINAQEGMLADRAFAPWADMETRLRESGCPLFALESQRPLRDFDVVGVSLAYELTFTNALNVIDLAGIPLRAADRGEGDPLVIAGGPCAFNPMPVAAFFDAIVVGDGEEATLSILRQVRAAKQGGVGRQALLEKLAGIEGVYVPGAARACGMARVADLEDAIHPRTTVVAHAATQERAAVEVARGCTRGCRFCQAGYIYRPARQRSGQLASNIACDLVRASGREDFSFLSLSLGDWPALGGALREVQNRCELEVGAQLPSLRAESLGRDVARSLGRARSGSFTLAPEAATERMRFAINKGNTDSDLYRSVESVFAEGWGKVKLYFMVGLPGETDEEIDGIARVARRCLEIGRRHHRRPTVTVSTSTFVPKAHTPFQWEAQIGIERTLEVQRWLKRLLRGPGLQYRWHDAGMSFLEGVLSRGGPELADAIGIAFRRGARFDGWDERFDLELWLSAFEEAGIDPHGYLEERAPDFEFPWERLGAGPSKDFLIRERRRAAGYETTPDCSTGPCSACGICDPDAGLVNRIAQVCHSEASEIDEGAEESPGARGILRQTSESTRPQDDGPRGTFRYRVKYAKLGRAAYLGHLEVVDALRRAFRAARLPLRYSEGFTPRAKVDGGPALAVGLGSRAEFVDVELASEMAPGDIVARLAGRLPDGMMALEAVQLEPGAASISESIARATYEIAGEGVKGRLKAAQDLHASDKSIPFERVRKGKSRAVEVRDYVDELAVEKGGVLRLSIRNLAPALRVSEVIEALLGISGDEARRLEITKAAVDWKDGCPTN